MYTNHEWRDLNFCCYYDSLRLLRIFAAITKTTLRKSSTIWTNSISSTDNYHSSVSQVFIHHSHDSTYWNNWKFNRCHIDSPIFGYSKMNHNNHATWQEKVIKLTNTTMCLIHKVCLKLCRSFHSKLYIALNLQLADIL